MAGIKKLRKILLGRETTAGTEIDATDTWRGTGTVEDQLDLVRPEEDVGYKSATTRAYIPKVQGAWDMDETPATFEQILHIFEAGIETVTPAVDGAGSGYKYDYPFATTTDTASVKSYTVEGGDNQQEEQFLYGFVNNFTLSGTAGEAVMMSAGWVGRQVATGTYTSTTPIPTVEEILFGKGTLYIDDDTGTMGTTPKTSTWLDFSLDVDTGWEAVYTGDGNLYFTFLKNVGSVITLDVTFEHETTGVAEIAKWRSKGGRLIRLKFVGDSFTTAGTSYTYPTLYIDLAGVWDSFEKIGERDGNDIVTGTMTAGYSANSSSYAAIKVVVAQATVA